MSFKRYKGTLVTFIALAIIVVIGTLVFEALENIGHHESFSLTIQIVTTVGYGNIPPKTNPGKIFCIFFALISIPVNVLLLQKIGCHIMNSHKFCITKIETKLLKRQQPTYICEKSFLWCLLNLVLLVLIGATIQVYHADWPFLDGVYCYVITFTTVGFGDLIPGYHGPINVAARVLLVFYNIIGLCIVSTAINCALECKIPLKILKDIRPNESNENERTEVTEMQQVKQI